MILLDNLKENLGCRIIFSRKVGLIITQSMMLFFVSLNSIAQHHKQVVYKRVDTTNLVLNIYLPENYDSGEIFPAMILFFGGGWRNGGPERQAKRAKYFASRGLVCFCPDYRTQTRHGTTPFDALKDARSAIRFIRKNARQFYIDPDKIVASGGSAGGQLASACAIVDGYDDEQDDLSVYVKPNALILFNPVIDNGPGGFGFERIGENYRTFSPLHNIHAGVPPTLIFLGTNDHLIPVETMKYFKKVMEKVGSHCDLFLYNKQKHGFSNSGKYYDLTLKEADRFLISLGYIGK